MGGLSLQHPWAFAFGLLGILLIDEYILRLLIICLHFLFIPVSQYVLPKLILLGVNYLGKYFVYPRQLHYS